MLDMVILKTTASSPFGGIPRNWKLEFGNPEGFTYRVPPSGGSLEIGNH